MGEGGEGSVAEASQTLSEIIIQEKDEFFLSGSQAYYKCFLFLDLLLCHCMKFISHNYLWEVDAWEPRTHERFLLSWVKKIKPLGCHLAKNCIQSRVQILSENQWCFFIVRILRTTEGPNQQKIVIQTLPEIAIRAGVQSILEETQSHPISNGLESDLKMLKITAVGKHFPFESRKVRNILWEILCSNMADSWRWQNKKIT